MIIQFRNMIFDRNDFSHASIGSVKRGENVEWSVFVVFRHGSVCRFVEEDGVKSKEDAELFLEEFRQKVAQSYDARS